MFKSFVALPILFTVLAVLPMGETMAEKSKAEQIEEKVQACESKHKADIDNCYGRHTGWADRASCNKGASLNFSICSRNAHHAVIRQ